MPSNDDETNILLVGDYDYEYPREREIHDGLELNGATVHEVRFTDEPIFIGPKKIFFLPYYYVLLSVRIARLSRSVDLDTLLLTKFNPTLIPVVWFWSRLFDSLLVYDLFVSLYRTAELRDVNPFLVKLIFRIEKLTLSLPDYHLTETNQFADFYADVYDLDRSHIVPLPVGVDERWFTPREKPTTSKFTVAYWGNFLPHHGLDTIVDAASKLDGDKIEFVFIGEGPEKERIQASVDDRNISGVRFEGRVPMEELIEEIAKADICLGIFSSDRRSRASITNKVSEGVAMGRPVVTMDSPAIRDWFTHGENIFLVPPEDDSALADAIRRLQSDDGLRTSIGENARILYENEFSPENLGRIIGESIPLSRDSR